MKVGDTVKIISIPGRYTEHDGKTGKIVDIWDSIYDLAYPTGEETDTLEIAVEIDGKDVVFSERNVQPE